MLPGRRNFSHTVFLPNSLSSRASGPLTENQFTSPLLFDVRFEPRAPPPDRCPWESLVSRRIASLFRGDAFSRQRFRPRLPQLDGPELTPFALPGLNPSSA